MIFRKYELLRDFSMEETNEVLKAIGQRVKNIRQHLNLRQNHFAQALDISNANLSEIEAGIAKPRFEFLYNISLKYNVNLVYLLHGKGEMFIDAKVEKEIIQEDGHSQLLRQLANIPNYKEFNEFLKYFNDSLMVRYAVMSYFITYKNQNEELIKKDIQLSKGGGS
jgi:transcriptional regulator with XRE-family HTH domain